MNPNANNATQIKHDIVMHFLADNTRRARILELAEDFTGDFKTRETLQCR